MDNKLYVGNLPFSTSEEDLRGMFAQAGTVVSVSLINDRDTGRSRGFAFVELSTQAEAEKAVSLFNNTPLLGKLQK
jgi:RNA recognition motif-containing protein